MKVEHTLARTHKVQQFNAASVLQICPSKYPHVSQARRKAVAAGTQFEPVFCAYSPHCLIPRQISMRLKNLKRQQYQTHAKTVSFAGTLSGVCRQETDVLQASSASVFRLRV